MINKYNKTPLRQFPRPQAKNAFYARKGDMRYRGNMSQSQGLELSGVLCGYKC